MTFQRRWKKRGAHLLDAPPSCRCPKIVPWYALVLDVDRFARAQGESGRTANRVANLFGCRVRPDVNRRCGWRDGRAARLGARHFDAHWVKMSRVKNATNWLTKLSCVSILAAPCGHCEAGETGLGGTSPKIQPAANDFSTT